jgi:hypothetical protein
MTRPQCTGLGRAEPVQTPPPLPGSVARLDPGILTNDQLREFCECPRVDHVSAGRRSQKTSQNQHVVRDSSDRLPEWT